ncbi:NADH dehydrogenase [Xanthomonas arboricola]
MIQSNPLEQVPGPDNPAMKASAPGAPGKSTPVQGRPHLVVVGGGVAGLEVATRLARKWQRKNNAPRITLVDHDSAHVWKPMLHTIAAGTRDISQQQTPYVAQAHNAGFVYQPGALRGLDRAARTISIAPLLASDGRVLIPARTLAYDRLVLAVGSRANDFGTPGVAEHCFMIDSRPQAVHFNAEVRVRLFQALASRHDVTIAIVGGGATGVELAAELVQLVQTSVAYGADELESRVSVLLIQSGERLLPALPADVAAAVQQRLESLGVAVKLHATVTSVDAAGLMLDDGSHIPASPVVWAAGVMAPAFLKQLDGLETTRSNQLVVNAGLQTTRDPAIFALGDCSSLLMEGAARPLPPTAQVAHQQADHFVRHIDAIMTQGAALPAFRYRDMGSLVSLGDYDAYGSLGKAGLFKGVTIRGRIAQLGHVLLYREHQSRLHGFWKGSLMWFVDVLNSRLHPRIRLD